MACYFQLSSQGVNTAQYTTTRDTLEEEREVETGAGDAVCSVWVALPGVGLVLWACAAKPWTACIRPVHTHCHLHMLRIAAHNAV